MNTVDENLSPAANCWNYIVRTHILRFGVIRNYVALSGEKEADNLAQQLWTEVMQYRLTRLSFAKFQEYFNGKKIIVTASGKKRNAFNRTGTAIKQTSKPTKKKKKYTAKKKIKDDWGIEFKPVSHWGKIKKPSYGKTDGEVQRANGYSERSLEEFRAEVLRILNESELDSKCHLEPIWQTDKDVRPNKAPMFTR